MTNSLPGFFQFLTKLAIVPEFLRSIQVGMNFYGVADTHPNVK